MQPSLWILIALVALVLAVGGMFVWEMKRLRRTKAGGRARPEPRRRADEDLEQAVRDRAAERAAAQHALADDDYTWDDGEDVHRTGRARGSTRAADARSRSHE